MAVPERSMTELLERAVELCPERFTKREAPEQRHVVYRVLTHGVWVEVATSLPNGLVVQRTLLMPMLGTLIEEIEARGRSWSVWDSSSHYEAIVLPSSESRGSSPAHALLGAFVSAFDEVEDE